MKDVKKLPKWAQQHIENLQRERDIAVQRFELSAIADTRTFKRAMFVALENERKKQQSPGS